MKHHLPMYNTEIVRPEETAMSKRNRPRTVLMSVLSCAFLAAWAADAPPASVSFAPGYEATVQRMYGTQEVPALRALVADAVAQPLKSARNRCSLGLDVTVERVAPTHPTMKQQMDSPSLDPIRTVYRDGGASLTGHVLDSGGHVLATVKYEHFNDLLRPLVAARDPWGDARSVFEVFSSHLVDACIKQTAAAGS